MDESHAWVGKAVRRAGGARVVQAMRPPGDVRVTMTHAVDERHLSQFDAIVRLLAGRRTPITPQQFLERFGGDSPAEPADDRLLVTFDDGLRSSYTAAKEVLDPLGIKAIFFVPTGILELRTTEEMRRFSAERIHYGRPSSDRLRPEEFLFMGPEQLLELHEGGHMILPHTHSHPRCSEIRTRVTAEQELREPKLILERLLGAPANGFALPVGTEHAVGPYSFAYIRELYRLCFTALAGANGAATDPCLLRRDSIHPWYSLEHVSNLIDGLYDPWYAARAWRLRRRVPERAAAGPAPPHALASHERARFVARVASVFEEAGIQHVLLHEGSGEESGDSDVDTAVGRDSLDLAHALIEAGALGRSLQCLRYADPWCRYYVLETDEPGRRYRQLDLVCDPWGIGRDGPAIEEALARAVVAGGLRTPDAAAETLYVAVKRARKRMHGPRHQESLVASFRRDPVGATELLERHFGDGGHALARALAAEGDLTDGLEAVRRRLRRRRRTPSALGRRAGFGFTRLCRRLTRPTGLLVFLVGPDGVGKSELARGLEQEAAGAFRRVVRLHFRPGLLPPPGRLLGRDREGGGAPHSRAPSGAIGSLARLGYLWADTLAAYLPKVLVPRIRSTFVVVERGWLDLTVDPARYRLSLPVRGIRAATRLLPRPDLVLNLDASPAVVCARKLELEPSEVERQLSVWRALAASEPNRFVSLDAAAPPKHVLAEALAAIDDRLSRRQPGVGSCMLAVRCLGALRREGTPYRIVRGRGGPRWLLPAHRGAPGPLGAGLYRPAGVRHVAAAVAVEAAQRLGLSMLGPRVAVDLEDGLAGAIGAALGSGRVELAAAVTGDPRRGERVLLSVRDGRQLVAFAKVAREEGSKLEHEFAVLRLLARCHLERLAVPEAIACFPWEDSVVLLLRPFQIRARADRPLTESELTGLAELGRLSGPLAGALGTEPNRVPIHGDFAPWNSDPRSEHRLLLWDWEQAALGLPLQDLFHWRLQRLSRFGRGTVRELVGSAFSPDPELRTLAEELGVPPAEAAPPALRTCLETAILRLPSAEVPRQALELLTAAGG